MFGGGEGGWIVRVSEHVTHFIQCSQTARNAIEGIDQSNQLRSA